MSAEQEMPPYAVLVRHHVSDFDAWKETFDAHEPVRKEAGFLGHHINQAEDDPNMLSLYFAVSDVDRAKAFAASDELKGIMATAGVDSPPEFVWMTPERQAVVWDRTLPAFIITHTVADFDAWLAGYDAAAELQQSHGIIGHAASRSIDDPSLAVVYHQAESFDALRAFLENPDLRAAMEDAGVTSPPDVSFGTGGFAKMY